MTDRLVGKYAVVTGGARGIGCAISLAFAREGASGVAVVDRGDEDARKVSEEIGTLGTQTLACHTDVSKEYDVARMAEHIYESFGRVDVLVNNAGIATSSNVAEMPLAMWEEMISVNLTSVFLCSRAFLSGMLAQGLGRIINVGSQLVLRGAAGIAHYCAAKGAVHAFTKALAREVAGQGITVNAIVPGPTETGMIAGVPEDALEGIRQEVPLGRFAKPEEVAPTAVLLAFDEGGAYYTGSFLNVSGGHMM